MKREEEINLLCQHLANVWNAGANRNLEALFEQAVQWADEHPKNPWVSVEERLPNDKQRVFICKSDGRMYCGKYNKSLKIFTTIDPSLTMWTINNVKAWMPIPEGGEK